MSYRLLFTPPEYQGEISVPNAQNGETLLLEFNQPEQLVANCHWDTPRQFSATMALSWDDAGLLVRVKVCEQHTRCDAPADKPWMGSSIELFFARPADMPLPGENPPQCAIRQLILTPPAAAGGQNSTATLLPKATTLDGTELAITPAQCSANASGYTLGAIIPKALFGGDMPWQEGAAFRFQCRINGFTTPNAEKSAFTYAGRNEQFFRSVNGFYTFTLTAANSAKNIPALDHQWHPALQPHAGEIHIQCPPFPGSDAITATLSPSTPGEEWNDAPAILTCTLPPQGGVVKLPEDTPDGYYALALSPTKNGQILGVIYPGVISLENAYSFLREHPLNSTAPTDPWKIRNTLAFAATLEAVKNIAARKFYPKLVEMVQEIRCRQLLLEGKALPQDTPPVLKNLDVTRDRQCHVAVEFPRSPCPPKAHVTVFCGSYPLCTATICQWPSEDEAKQIIRRRQRLTAKSTPVRINGVDEAWLLTGNHCDFTALYTDFDAAHEVTLFLGDSPNTHYRMPLLHALELSPDAIIIEKDTPPNIRIPLALLSQERKLPVIPVNKRQFFKLVIAGGTMPKEECRQCFTPGTGVAYSTLVLRRGDILWEITAEPTPEIALHFAKILLEHRAVTPKDVDTLRKLRLKGMPRVGSPQTEPLWVGDVHTHSHFSDGSVSPAALLLQAPYAGMEFVVVSDHNNAEGGLAAQQSARECNYSFPVCPGEEITTTKRFHLNLYPVTRSHSPNRQFHQICQDAHDDGAIVQLNHPTTYGAELNPYWYPPAKGITAELPQIDAVERNVSYAQQWQEMGNMPVFVGGTDTHCGTYGDQDKTVLRCNTPAPEEIANAIRTRNAAKIDPRLPDYVYGDHAMRAAVAAELRRPEMLELRAKKRTEELLNPQTDLLAMLEFFPPDNPKGRKWFRTIDPNCDFNGFDQLP